MPFVAHGDGVAVQGAGAVHEADAATGAGVHVVGLVGEGDVTVAGGDRAAGQRAVAVVVVPRAVLALVVVRVGAVRGQDHVVGVTVRRGRGVAEVGSRLDRLGAELVAGGRARRCRRVVVPHASEHAAALVGDEAGVGGAAGRAGLHVGAVAPLGQVGRPQFVAGADALEHLLRDGRAAVGVTGEGQVAVAVGALRAPLAAVEDEIHLGVSALHTDAVDPATVGQRFRPGRGHRLRVRLVIGTHLRQLPDGG